MQTVRISRVSRLITATGAAALPAAPIAVPPATEERGRPAIMLGGDRDIALVDPGRAQVRIERGPRPATWSVIEFDAAPHAEGHDVARRDAYTS